MSFRSTFASPGGFTTQRLDLILKKRKDDASNTEKTTSYGGSSSTPSSVLSTVAKRPTSMTEGVSSPSRGDGESALDRWRKRMADQGMSPQEHGPVTSSATRPTSSLLNSQRSRDGVSMSFSSVEPRRRLDFGSYMSNLADEDGGEEQGTSGRRSWRANSSLSLPRRRAERERSNAGTVGSRLRGSHVNGTSVSSSHLERVNSRSSDRGAGISDPRGSVTSLNIPSERSLTSKRFQALFSGKDSGGEEGSDESEDDYSDSLEGDMDVSEGPTIEGPTLKRSASSASTILQGSKWTPASKLLRDRYEIAGGDGDTPGRAAASPVTSSRAPGTRSNWAAWRGDIHRSDVIGDDKGSILTHSNQTDRKANSTTESNDVGRKGSNNNIKGSLTLLEPGEELQVNPTPAPLPAALHLTAFPGYAGGISGGMKPLDASRSSRPRSGHWAGHVPQSATGYTPPEWYLHRGTASVSSDSGSTLDKGFRKGPIEEEGEKKEGDVPTQTGQVSYQKGDFTMFTKHEATAVSHSGKNVSSTSPKDISDASSHQERSGKSTSSENDSVFGAEGEREQEEGEEEEQVGPVSQEPAEHGGQGQLCVKRGQEEINMDYRRVGNTGPSEVSAVNSQGEGVRQEGGISVKPEESSLSPANTIQQSRSNTTHNAKGTNGTDILDYHHLGSLPQPDPLTAAFRASTDLPDSKATKSIKDLVGRSEVEAVVQAKRKPPAENLADSRVSTPKRDIVNTEVVNTVPFSETLINAEQKSSAIEGTDSVQAVTEATTVTPTVLLVQEVTSPGDLALRNTRVSFSDDLKVVPASPSPERKTWQAPETVAPIHPNGAGNIERDTGAVTPTSTAITSQGETLSMVAIAATTTTAGTPSSPSVKPWEVVGRTPVKGILQNGRKEGEVVHRPAPDDSEMRTQEDPQNEGEQLPSAALRGNREPMSKRHSFSTSRDVPHTYRRYMSKITPTAVSSSKPNETIKKVGSGTPTVERRVLGGTGKVQVTPNVSYKSPTRSSSLRSTGGERTSLSSHHNRGRGGDGASTEDTENSASRIVKPAPSVQRRHKVGKGMKGSTEGLNTSRTSADGHSYSTKSKLRGSTDSLSGHTDRERRDSRSILDKERRDSKLSMDRNRQGYDHKPRGTGLKGSTDSLSANCNRGRRNSKSFDKEKHDSLKGKPDSQTTDKEKFKATDNGEPDSHITDNGKHDPDTADMGKHDSTDRGKHETQTSDKIVDKKRHDSKSNIVSAKQTHKPRLVGKDLSNNEKLPKSGKDQDSTGFTLSFKDFMEQRKKQGTCVLPPKSKDKVGGNTVVADGGGSSSSSNRVRTQSESSADSSSSPRESKEGSCVTLSSLKQIRDREGHSKKSADTTQRTNNGDSKTSDRADDVQESTFKRKDEGGHRWSFRSRKKKQSEHEAGSENNSAGSRKKEQGVATALSNFFKRSKRTSKRLSAAADTKRDGANSGEGDVEGPVANRIEESKTGSTGHTTDAENHVEVGPSPNEVSASESGFTLGPHGHSDNERDPLSALFMKAEAVKKEEDLEGEVNTKHAVDGDRTAGTDGDALKPLNRSAVDRSPIGLLLDMVGTPSNSPTLSGISSVDDEGTNGNGAPTGGHNRYYEHPVSDYKYFLDMDSLVASITTNKEGSETLTESSSGISANTGSDSASGLGSLEDLAMALLESELREEGLLEGEPGLPEPAQNYQARIQGIKADLHKFSIQVGRALKKHRRGDSTERTSSVSDFSITSTRSSRSPWLRDPMLDAKPITDPLLRSKLKTARIPGARVTSRDQKILELMMAKREEEKAAEKKRELARRTWELQKERDDALKTNTDLRRRESLVRQRQQKEPMKGRRHTGSTDSLHSTYSERPDLVDTDCEDAHCYRDRQWSSQSQKIAELREKKMAERRMQNMQRKKSQEDRITAQKQEQEEMTKLVRERQERELKRASSMKETKEQDALRQKKLKNYYQKKRHEERMGDLKRKSREDISNLQSTIEMKQASAQSHLNAIESRKYNELRKSTSGSMTDLDTRISRSKENQQRLQEELTAWHGDLHKYRQMMEKRAEEQNKVAVAQKAKRAAEERRQKEKLQKKNFKKLLAQEEEWKADVEASIAMKDAKTRMLQMEKDETMQESRAMAVTSQRLREELRSAYSSDTIDQLSKQAHLQAKLGLESVGVNAGLAGTTKNMSTLTLG